MSATVRCRVEAAHVRPEKADALSALIQQLFNRRNLAYIEPKDRMWLTVELIQSLRRQSTVYRTLSEKTSGPLPFGIGYFRVHDGRLEPVSTTLPTDDPEVLVRVLSEFVEPGALFTFEMDEAVVTWRVEGENEVARRTGAASTDGPASASTG